MMSESSGLEQTAPDGYVLDSWPLLEWLKKREPAFSRFRGLLTSAGSGETSLMMSDLNLGEVYYLTYKDWGATRAEEVWSNLRLMPIHVLHPTPADVLEAARLKGRYSISYADCFAALLARQRNVPLVTGDRDFLPLHAAGVIRVEWWGA